VTRPMSMTTKPMSLQRASYIVAAFSLLGVSAFHCGFAAQSDFVRFSKPELLTFDQLVDLEKNDPPSPALAEKLEHLVTTPFLSNEAYFNGAKPKRPSSPQLGPFQSVRNPSGAVGIMQVIPQYAAAPPISIPNVEIAEGNIHAGAKMMRNIADTYFNDPKLDPLNKILMTFASYNAGPNRIADLRKRAEGEGLDPNRWFGNVELIVARDVGEQTVQYVSNIYKYYVAYKLTLEESKAQ